MAARTLNTTWKQFEKLAERYFHKKPPKGIAEEIADLVAKINESKIADALCSLLVSTYPGTEAVTLRFASLEGKKFPEWMTRADVENKSILVNPVAIFRFTDECRKAPEALKGPEARESFSRYRRQAFMAEIGKLPSRFILFLAVLEAVARYKEVSKADKRPVAPDAPENDEYLNLLWAFKELETFINETTGVNIRTEYNLLWYEAEWINGK